MYKIHAKIVSMKIAMVAGGSGGHIYPAVSLAKELEKRGHEVTFIGANDRMEKDVIPTYGFKFIGLDTKTTKGGLVQKVSSLLSMRKSYIECKKILKDNYDLVMGFGNYISVPVIMAASKLKIKVVLHEQNSFVGRANRMLDKKADLIITSYEESNKQFKNPNIITLGNPQSSVAAKVTKDQNVLKELNLDLNKKTVLIFMGSLGSESIMNVMLDYFKLLDTNIDYQIVYATGVRHYDKVKDLKFKNVHIFDKVDGINVMANSDLLVSRAGATTLAEITALGMPSILIPSPYVPNNHQYHNAMALVDKKAALMIEEKDLDAFKLKELIEKTLNDESKLKDLSLKSRMLSNDNVVDDIIDRLENLWK